MTVTGNVNAGYANVGRFVEVSADSVNNAFIDFHSNDANSSAVDYDGRILCNGGTNATTGQGAMTYTASSHTFNGTVNASFGSINGTINFSGSDVGIGGSAQPSQGKLTVYNDVVLYNNGQVKFGSGGGGWLNRLYYYNGSVGSSGSFQYVLTTQQIGMYRISAYNINSQNWAWSENIGYFNGGSYFWGGEDYRGTNPDFDFRISGNQFQIGIRNNNGNNCNYQIRVEAFD
jgi:hypothetical protein